jgi:hypothetical protein
MSLDNSNYYEDTSYMSASQFKGFQNCEAQELAKFKGEYKTETTSAMLIGSYVDAWFEGTLEDFKSSHPEIFTQKGTLRAEFVQAQELINRVSRDEKFMAYMGGEKQIVFTGTIADVPFKGKLDSYIEGKCIVDLKTCKDFEPVWKNHRKMSFVEAYGYDIQLAIYQELVRQNTGEQLPVYICAVTKEKVPNIEIMQIDQARLDECLELVKANAPHYQDVKLGKVEPSRCCKCDYCKTTKKLVSPIHYLDLNPELTPETVQKTAQKQPVSVGSIVSLPNAGNPHSVDESAVLEGKKDKKKKRKKKVKVLVIKL